jgi:uncharacterized membrane protein YhaH (DUF805 family)
MACSEPSRIFALSEGRFTLSAAVCYRGRQFRLPDEVIVMPTKTLFFSFAGRINRGIYWTRAMPVLLVGGVIVNLVMLAEVVATERPGPFSMLLSLLALWPSLAVTVKRLHDRNRSGWFLLIILIPIVGAIWLLVEVWFLKGTDGPNRFGEPPAEATAVTVVSACVLAMLAAGYFTLFQSQGPDLIEVRPAEVVRSAPVSPDSTLSPATVVSPEPPSGAELPSATPAPAPATEVPQPYGG